MCKNDLFLNKIQNLKRQVCCSPLTSFICHIMPKMSRRKEVASSACLYGLFGALSTFCFSLDSIGLISSFCIILFAIPHVEYSNCAERYQGWSPQETNCLDRRTLLKLSSLSFLENGMFRLLWLCSSLKTSRHAFQSRAQLTCCLVILLRLIWLISCLALLIL